MQFKRGRQTAPNDPVQSQYSQQNYMKDGFSDEGSGNDGGNDGDGIKRHPDETAV